MKKIIVAAVAGCLGFALSPFSFMNPKPTETHQMQANGKNVRENTSKLPKRHFLIRDSVKDPLPPDVKNTEMMPSANHPQDLPNFNYSTTIVITKMPYHDEKQQPSNVR